MAANKDKNTPPDAPPDGERARTAREFFPIGLLKLCNIRCDNPDTYTPPHPMPRISLSIERRQGRGRAPHSLMRLLSAADLGGLHR